MNKIFFLTVGFLALALGVVGIFLPLLPTTPFLILAAFCFNRGSPKFHSWLLSHPILGPPVEDWNRNRAIQLKYKILVTVMMSFSALFLFTREGIPHLGKVAFATFTLALLTFVWTRNSK